MKFESITLQKAKSKTHCSSAVTAQRNRIYGIHYGGGVQEIHRLFFKILDLVRHDWKYPSCADLASHSFGVHQIYVTPIKYQYVEEAVVGYE
jgi:hypothetical protein